MLPFYNKFLHRYCLPFPGSDAAVVRRSQQNLITMGTEHVTPVQFAAYFTLPNLFWTVMFVVSFAVPFSKQKEALLDRCPVLSFR